MTELLIGAGAFWARAAADIARARHRVLVQAMTFEGDAAGLPVAAAVGASAAGDRRVLVDSYSRAVINDRFVASPGYLRDPAFRAEVRATHAMFAGLAAQGVGVRRTNPIGWNWLRYGVRNHKKLIVADYVAYLGGINFSEHNFGWQDLMLRIEDRAAARFLADDFAATWAGRPRAAAARFGQVTLHALDGAGNEVGFRPLLDALATARRSIAVVSPYLTFPFLAPLEAAAARGVAVEILTPLANNKPIVRDYLLGATRRSALRVRLIPEMSHLKAILIDEETLIVGSSNFDFASYHVEEELVARIDDAALAADFRARVLAPLRAGALDPAPHAPEPARAWRAEAGLRIAAFAMRRMANSRRTAIPWR